MDAPFRHHPPTGFKSPRLKLVAPHTPPDRTIIFLNLCALVWWKST